MADALMNSDHLLTRAPMRVITHACESPFSLDRSRSGSGRRDSPGAGAGQDRLHRQATRDSMAATRIASRGCTSTARSPSAWCSITPAALVSACVPITSGWSSAAPTSPNTPPADRVSARRNDESAPGSRNGRGRPANACAAAVGAVWPRPCQDEPSAPPTLPRSAQPNASALPPPACPDRLASALDACRLHAGGWPWRAAGRLAGRAADVAPTCGHAGPACVLCGACRACHARAAAAPNGGPMGLGRVHRPVLSSDTPRPGIAPPPVVAVPEIPPQPPPGAPPPHQARARGSGAAPLGRDLRLALRVPRAREDPGRARAGGGAGGAALSALRGLRAGRGGQRADRPAGGALDLRGARAAAQAVLPGARGGVAAGAVGVRGDRLAREVAADDLLVVLR